MAVPNSSIEWTDSTWSPVTGCTKVSAGCDHCYAETIANRFAGSKAFPNAFEVTLHPQRLDQPLKWRKPRRIFVNSMSDLFHDSVPDEYIANVWEVMTATPQHTYQILTKRHARMRSWYHRWPNAVLSNVWLGVSVENQQWADIRIPALLDTPAAVRWISAEPLLGPVVLRDDWLGADPYRRDEPHLNWIVVGGESGPGARPMHPHWARSLRNQCQAAGVPFLFKQWGEYVPATVEDDPQFAGGRAFNNPRSGGRTAAVVREPAVPNRHFEGGRRRLMEPGDETEGGVIMLDGDTVAVRVGKKRAGRELDGRTWDEFPAPALAGAR